MCRLPAEHGVGQTIAAARCSVSERFSVRKERIAMKIAIAALCVVGALGFESARGQELLEDIWFKNTESLAQRDEYGLLHSSKVIYPTDLEKRYHWRPLYYLEGEHDVQRMPAYVGALQVALKRLGYYCGPIDGVFS